MQAWIASIIGWIIRSLASFVKDAWDQASRLSDALLEIDKKTQKQADDLNNSVTDDEDEKAAKEILSRRE
jgi:hypothetical protein